MTMKQHVVIAATAVLVAACGPVADTRFVSTLMSHGIPGDRFAEIGAAHQLCDAWRQLPKDASLQNLTTLPGSAMAEAKAATNTLTSQGMSGDQLGQFITDAMDTECPEVRRG
jgi:hypothetical protein